MSVGPDQFSKVGDNYTKGGVISVGEHTGCNPKVSGSIPDMPI